MRGFGSFTEDLNFQDCVWLSEGIFYLVNNKLQGM